MSSNAWDVDLERSIGYATDRDLTVELHFEQSSHYGMVVAYAFSEAGLQEGEPLEVDEWENDANGIGCTGPEPGEWDMDVGAYDGTVEVVGKDADGDTIVSIDLDFGVEGHVRGTAVVKTWQGEDPWLETL